MTTIQALLFVSIAYIALGEPSPQQSWQPVLFLEMTKQVFIGQKEELRILAKLEGAMYKKDETLKETDFQDVVGILTNGIRSVESEPVVAAPEGNSFPELNEGLPLVFTVNKSVLAFIGPKHPKEIFLKLDYEVWAKTKDVGDVFSQS